MLGPVRGALQPLALGVGLLGGSEVAHAPV
jgi:hypothetical protein